MATELIHLGFSNILAANRIIAIISPNSAPSKRMILEAKKNALVIDMTNGRRTKAVVVIDTGHVILAAINPETIAGRIASNRDGNQKADPIEELALKV